MSREQDFYTLTRQANTQIWDALNQMAALRREWTARDFGSSLDAGEGQNEGLVKDDLQSVLFTTGQALDEFLTNGFHYTGMAKLL